MLTLEFAGSRYEHQKEAPEGVTETIKLWLRAAHLDGAFTYRTIDRAKGTGTMSRVHAISVRDGTFVNARIRPDGRGNASSWIVSIPVPAGQDPDRFLSALQSAERIVNGDEDKFLESKLAMLYTYLDGNPIEVATLDPRMASRSKFETIEYMEHELDTLAARKLFVRKTGPGKYVWRKHFPKVPVPPLQEAWAAPPAELFVLSLTPDERVLLMELMNLHARMEDANGRVQLRLPNELPLFEEEIAQFMDKAELFGLVKSVGDNPHGILGKVWNLEFPLLLVCVMQMKFLFPQEAQQRTLLEDGVDPGRNWTQIAEIQPGYTTDLEQNVALSVDAQNQEATEASPSQEERPAMSFEIVQTWTLEPPPDRGNDPLYQELEQTQKLLDEVEARRADHPRELDRLREEVSKLTTSISERERASAEDDELSIRLEAQMRAVEEKIRASETQRAEEVADRMLTAIKTIIEDSDVDRWVLTEVLKRRMPPGISFP